MSDALQASPRADRNPALVAVAHGVAASWFTALYAPLAIAFVAFLAGATGAILGHRAANRGLRTPVLVGTGLGLTAMGLVWNGLATALPLLPSWVGPGLALRVGELGSFGLASLGVSFALRSLGSRIRSFVVLEVAAFAAIALQQLAAHRFGAIHRPFELADVMLLAGQDPAIGFYAFGALAAAVVGMFLVRERSPWRLLYHVVFLGSLLLTCLIASITGYLPVPSPEQAQSQRETEDEHRSPSGGQGQGESGNSQGKVAVAVVVFHDDYSTPLETYYFRQESFSRFDGARLAPGIDPDLAPTPPSRPFEVAEPPPSGATRMRVQTTIGMLIRSPGAIALESPIRYEPQRNTNPQRFSTVYRVTSLASEVPYDQLVGREVGSPAWSEYERRLYTAPHPDPRYPELARRIVDEMLPPEIREDPVAQTMAITTWLGREGQYSLHHLQDAGPDPGSEFLFGEKIGFCVHFANAAVHLLRALGIPSRIGAGFAVAESERQGGSSMLLMQHMAHAWPEIYVEGEGWMVADVYPERSLEPPFEPGDVELARLLGEMARGEIPPPSATPPPVAEVVAEVIREAPRYARFALYALVGIFVLLQITRLFRRIHPRFAGAAALPRAAYRSVADALAEAGIRRARGESREAFASRIAAEAPTFVGITDALEASAFGGREYHARVGRLADASRRARAELRAKVPLWRRLLAILDPISFLTAR